MIPANTNKAQTIFRNGKTNFRQNWSSRTLQHSKQKRPHSDSDTLLRFAASPDVTGHNLNRTETRPRVASRLGWPGWATSGVPPTTSGNTSLRSTDRQRIQPDTYQARARVLPSVSEPDLHLGRIPLGPPNVAPTDARNRRSETFRTFTEMLL